MPPSGFLYWVKPALQNRRTVKTWIRCCVVVAATLILLVSRKPSNLMGQAAFFVVLIAVLLPPNLAFSVFFYASMTLLIGMAVGWAWGSAAMAAGLSVRDASLLARQKTKVAGLIDPKLPPVLRTSGVVFHGLFLDPRVSAVYGAFLFIGTYSFAALQAHAPNLAVFSIFGNIVLDVICTMGPLLPTSNYLIARSIILPTTFYVAVALAGLVIVFPESLSHVWITSLHARFLTPTLALLKLQSEALASQPSDSDAWAQRNAKGLELRTALTASVDAVMGQLKLIDLDVSVGRLGPADLKRINAELKYIMFHARGLHAFHTFVADSNDLDKKHAEDSALALSAQAPSTRSVNRFHNLRAQIVARESRHGHDLDTLVPILFAASAGLRGSTEAALAGIIDWLQVVNTQRLSGLFRAPDSAAMEKRQQDLQVLLKDLQKALLEFKTTERIQLIRPYEKFFDPVTKKRTPEDFASRSLYICFVFIDTLGTFAEKIVDLLQIVTELDAQRTKVQVWFPGRVVAVKENILGSQFNTQPLSLGTSSDPESFESPDMTPDSSQTDLGDDSTSEPRKENFARSPEKRNPDAFPPATKPGKAWLRLAAFLRFFTSPAGIFGLRTGILSVALWIPSVCHSTAWFYYDNKGLWGLIMGQTALAVYAGDQIAGFLSRFTGTILGLLTGLVAWYIGAGLGHGFPYGVVISGTVALAPILLGRIASPPSQVPFWSIYCLTIVFVIGYSWINANHVVLSNPGVGITLGWKRALLVIIGFTTAFIVMVLPNPKSVRVLVRKTLAAVISEEGHIFASEVEAFLSEDERAKRGEFEDVITALPRNLTEDEKDSENKSIKEKRILHIAKRFVSVSDRLMYIRPSLITAKFEPQLAGVWPHEQYEKLFALQMRMLGSIALLITSFAKLNTKWCRALIHRTPYMNPNFLSDVFMTVTILSNTLMAGTPLPAAFPKLRDRLVYHGRLHSGDRFGISPQRNIHIIPKPVTSVYGSSSDTIDNLKAMSADNGANPSHVDGSSLGFEDDEITLDLLMNEQLPVYSTAIVALSSLISRLDDTMDIVRTLCGEASFQGFDNLQRDYLDREDNAYSKH